MEMRRIMKVESSEPLQTSTFLREPAHSINLAITLLSPARERELVMSYDGPIVVEDAWRSFSQKSGAGIDPSYATAAAKMLIAVSPKFAGTLAAALHQCASQSLDVDLIEHWARVVVQINRISGG